MAREQCRWSRRSDSRDCLPGAPRGELGVTVTGGFATLIRPVGEVASSLQPPGREGVAPTKKASSRDYLQAIALEWTVPMVGRGVSVQVAVQIVHTPPCVLSTAQSQPGGGVLSPPLTRPTVRRLDRVQPATPARRDFFAGARPPWPRRGTRRSMRQGRRRQPFVRDIRRPRSRWEQRNNTSRP